MEIFLIAILILLIVIVLILGNINTNITNVSNSLFEISSNLEALRKEHAPFKPEFDNNKINYLDRILENKNSEK